MSAARSTSGPPPPNSTTPGRSGRPHGAGIGRTRRTKRQRRRDEVVPRPVRPGRSFNTGYGLDGCADGTVADDSTGLMWQQTAAGNMTWEQAVAYCENLSLGGYGDWSSPTSKELRSVSNDSLAKPSIDTGFFPGALPEKFWFVHTEIKRRLQGVVRGLRLRPRDLRGEGDAARCTRRESGASRRRRPPATRRTHTRHIRHRIAPGQPGPADVVSVTARVSPGRAFSLREACTTRRAGSGGLVQTPFFREQHGAPPIEAWRKRPRTTPGPSRRSTRDNIEQRRGGELRRREPGRHGGSGPARTTFRTRMVWNTQGSMPAGNGTYIEFYLWADGLEAPTDGTFQARHRRRLR